MKGSWLLAPLLVTIVATSEAPRPRMPVAPQASLALALQKLDDALARADVETAVRAWEHAHRAAMAGGSWEDLITVGDASRRVDEIEGLPEASDTRAREIYLAALHRARRLESLDGVLRAGEALAMLGDREGVALSLRSAEALAALDPDAQADVRAFASRLGDLLVTKDE